MLFLGSFANFAGLAFLTYAIGDRYPQFPSSAPLPSAQRSMFNFFISGVVLDLGFFITHVSLHSKYMYGWCHKVHHEYQGPISISAEHSHWFEAIYSNLLTTILGPWLCGMHMCEWWAWLVLRLFGTYVTHSGYAAPYPYHHGTLYHDFHHTINTGNYSGDGFWDYIFGFNDSWYLAKSKQKLVPAKS